MRVMGINSSGINVHQIFNRQGIGPQLVGEIQMTNRENGNAAIVTATLNSTSKPTNVSPAPYKIDRPS